MIIDFNFPNLTPKGWRVEVTKGLNDGRVFVLPMVFEDKKDAYAYHAKVRQQWLNGRTR